MIEIARVTWIGAWSAMPETSRLSIQAAAKTSKTPLEHVIHAPLRVSPINVILPPAEHEENHHQQTPQRVYCYRELDL